MTRARILLLVALACTWLSLGPQGARADDGPQGEVTITSITPSLVDPADVEAIVTIEGRYTNTTGSPLSWATAEFWHYDRELSTFDHVDVALSTPASAPTGTRYEPGVTLAEDEPLQPGETVRFSVSAPVAELGMGADERGTVVGVHIRAVADEAGPRLTVGRARALLPNADLGFVVADVHLLTAPRPPQVHGANPVIEEFTQHLSSTLLPALEDVERDGDTTAVLDPALLQAALQLATGEDEDAAAFVAGVERLREQERLWRLPHGNPNLTRMPERLLAEVPAWADDIVPDELADVPSVAIVPDGFAAPPGFDHVLAFGSNPDFWRLYELSPSAEPMVLEDEPTEGTAPPGLPLDDEPWPELDEAVASLEAGHEARLDLTTEPGTEPIAAVDIRPLVLSAYGSSFPSAAEAVAHLESSRAASFDPDDITFTASPSFVMGARTNEFPTTITNATPFDVYLRIAVRSENRLRLDVPDTDILEVRSGESLTALLRPEASGNGVTMVHAQLESQHGRRFGPVVDIEITATEFGRVGWIIIIVSGAVVLGGTVWRIRAVQRERAKEASEPGQ